MPRVREPRFDFRGGVCTAFSEDALDLMELLEAKNTRLTEFGALLKRAGTQRIHTDEIESGTKILGIIEWDDPGGTELACVSNSDFYHKTLAATTWTEIAAGLSTTNHIVMVQHSIAGSATLYIADGGTLNKFDGTTLTEGISGSPSATYIEMYMSRMFAADGTKTLYWSKVADPDTWGSTDGGDSSPVGYYGTEPIKALKACGASLLIFKEDSISRFTGTTSDDIRIEAEVQGVSPDVGCMAPMTVVRVEDYVFFLSDRGPYIATEAGVQAIGAKVEDQFSDWDSDAVAVHNRGRREVWLFDGAASSSEFWIWNYRTQSWTGPHTFGDTFHVCTAARYERSDGTESIVLAGHDGYVRDGDIEDNDAKDDVLNDDSGGTNITMQCKLPPLLFGDPSTVKLLHPTQWIHADLLTSGSLQTIWDAELTSQDTLTISSPGTGLKEHKVRPACRGRRPYLTLKDATSEIITITGVTLEAEMGRRSV